MFFELQVSVGIKNVIFSLHLFGQQNCEHDLVSEEMSSLEICAICGGPFALLKWTGERCKGEVFLFWGFQSKSFEHDITGTP